MSSSQPLSGSVAMVTGASSGIGKATTEKLAAAGAAVAVIARSTPQLEDLASQLNSEHGVATSVHTADIRDVTAVQDAVESAVETHGTLDIVVSNAGIERGNGKAVDEITVDNYRKMVDTNVNGTFYTAHAALPYLRKNSGSLVFIGSFAGQYPRPDAPIYASTKWWTRGFALSVAAEVGADDVAVTVVNPSEVRTAWTPAEGEKSLRDQIPTGEATEPEDVADAVLFTVKQDEPNTVSELNLYRRGKLTGFGEI